MLCTSSGQRFPHRVVQDVDDVSDGTEGEPEPIFDEDANNDKSKSDSSGGGAGGGDVDDTDGWMIQRRPTSGDDGVSTPRTTPCVARQPRFSSTRRAVIFSF